ncbi:hypothetical protein B0H12DRAFT_1097553 [Mycena haematopus]|nr:hypothetical protein B0H12DRAFT_1097553 [Mycena haematopus]
MTKRLERQPAGHCSILAPTRPGIAGQMMYVVANGGRRQVPIMAFTVNQSVIFLAVASWLNVALYTFELILFGRYFARSSRPLVHRIGVGLMLLFDTICTLAVGFDLCLTMEASVVNLRVLLTPLVVQIITTYATSVVAQLFLCNLLYRLTGSIIVAGPILILIFVHLAFSWASAILILTTLSEAHSGMAFKTTAVGTISCSVTDVVIALSLGWKFWTMMAGASREHPTKSLLRRILILTISSGALCATNTLSVMLLLLENSQFFTFFFTCQGRVYALTVLGNFLVGVPDGQRSKRTIPSQRFDRDTNNNIVVFRSIVVETTRSAPADTKSSRRLASPTSTTQPFNIRGEEPVELGELSYSPTDGEANSEPDSPIRCTEAV